MKLEDYKQKLTEEIAKCSYYMDRQYKIWKGLEQTRSNYEMILANKKLLIENYELQKYKQCQKQCSINNEQQQI